MAQPLAYFDEDEADVWFIQSEANATVHRSVEAAEVLSNEDILRKLIWDTATVHLHLLDRLHYGVAKSELEKLKSEHGEDPYFFERYYHPAAQYWTAFNLGRAGMPIVKKVHTPDGKMLVELSTMTEQAQIYYTLDGTTPDENSQVYRKVLEILPGTIIKAKTIRTDLQHSAVAVVSNFGHAIAPVNERFDEEKIMGIYPVPNSTSVLIKFKTKQAGSVDISLVDSNRKSHFIKRLTIPKAQYDECMIDTAVINPSGAYLIKFQFESGKKTYRQVMLN